MRVRLRVVVSVFLTLVLLVSGLLSYSYYRSQVIRSLEVRLVVWADNIIAEIAKNPERFRLDPDRFIYSATTNEFTSGTILVQFMSMDGELKTKSPSLIYFHLPFSLGEDDVIKDVEIDDGTKLKVYQRLIQVRGRSLGYVVIGATTTQSYHNLTILRNILSVFTILTVVILGYTINAVVSRNVMANHRRFFSFASHELRTPLAIILGNAEMALKSDDPVSQRAALETIKEEAEWTRRLVSNLLLIFRSLSGSEILSPSTFNFSEIVIEEVTSLKNRVPERIVSLQLPGHAEFFGDPDRIRQVLRNLLDNAAKHTPPNGRIDVHLAIFGPLARLIILDNGTGMDPVTQRHAFDAYYRINDITDGVGLGLAIVKSIVNAHWGTIRLKSEPGQGSQFVVTLLNLDLPRPLRWINWVRAKLIRSL
ncbi:sensor histidine kinase [bacterium]|nr:sensor histidine kinase [bacterium]